jgi:hypothetical protein
MINRLFYRNPLRLNLHSVAAARPPHDPGDGVAQAATLQVER